MKKITILTIMLLLSSSLFAEKVDKFDETMTKYQKYMKEKREYEKKKEEKEWNDPYNKRMREMQKNYVKEVYEGDKKEQQLNSDILNSVKSSNK